MIALFAAAMPGPVPADSPASEPEVQALVARARQGDQVAARRLFRLYASRVYRAVRPLLPSDDEAEEVVQECFVRAFAALDRYRPSPRARCVSWLLTIASNRARTRARRARRLVSADDETIDRLRQQRGEVEPGPHAGGDEDAARRTALLTVLAELDPTSRQILSLRYGAGLTAAEVGRICGLGEANVRKQCQRLRQRVLERVEARLRAGREAEQTEPDRGPGAARTVSRRTVPTR